MNTTEFNKIKQQVLNRPVCYREVDAGDLVALGGDCYGMGTTIFAVDEKASKAIDKFNSIRLEQKERAQDSYGERGLADLRNYFGKTRAKNNGRLVMVADYKQRRVVDALAIKGELIPPGIFFDFAEMFMDKNNYLPDKVEYSLEHSGEVSLKMLPVNKQCLPYAPGDEFIANGLVLKWNPGEISLNNYFVRLVCSNGQTMTISDTVAKINSFGNDTARSLLDMSNYSAQLNCNTQKMIGYVNRAMGTNASVRELGIAYNALHNNGVPAEIAKQIIPYKQNMDRYLQAGYEKSQMQRAVSDQNMWDVLNLLTHFATHNEMWKLTDIRRTIVLNACAALLMRDRDIVEYYDIY